ncbi:hypothetical protein GGI05_006638 [Coemansia sp. RSA 2603]|nr:hypothetical protein GGI05_006638 [Coemansia sp. RSA 2603]
MSLGQQQPIIGGQSVETHEYPFVVYLSIETQPSWHAVCGGTLISDRHIVTAGHCLYHAPSANAVRIGYGNTHVRQQQSVRAQNYTIHPDFNPRTLFNDIAVIELHASDRIKPSDRARWIPVYFGSVDPGLTLTTMGWGITSNSPGARTVPVMNRVDLSVASNEACTAVDQTFASSDGPFVCTSTFAGGASGAGSRDQCNGDSGSPAVITMSHGKSLVHRKHRWRVGSWRRKTAGPRGAVARHADMRLVALTSYGDNIHHDVHPACGDPSGFGFSTHVAHYEDFLTNVTGLSRQMLEQPAGSEREVSSAQK